MRGAVVEWLLRLTVVRKVAGWSPARAKRLEKSHCSPSIEWVSEKVTGGERRELGPAFQMPCPKQDGALTSIAPTVIRVRAPSPYLLLYVPREWGTILIIVPVRSVLFKIMWATSWENLFYVICEQQRRRSACASAQSDKQLCCSLLR